MIPDRIPIPLTSIDDHLRAATEHLIRLLTNKKKPVGPYCKPSTKQELIRLAQILQRDKTPSIQPLPQQPPSKNIPTSESPPLHEDDATGITSNTSTNRKLPTSEGDKGASKKQVSFHPSTNFTNKKITSMPKDSNSLPPTSKGEATNNLPKYIMPPTHAALYPKASSSSSLPSTKSHPTSKKSSLNSKSPYNIDIINKDKFNKFLKTYVKHNTTPKQVKRKAIQHSKISKKKPSVRTLRKSIQPSPLSKSSAHPMKLRFRATNPSYTPFRHLAAQHLALSFSLGHLTHINHI